MRLDRNESRKGFSFSDRKGKSFPRGGAKTEKAREPTVESVARNLEAKSVRSRAASTGVCVKPNTVTKIRRGRERDRFIAESVYLVLNSLWDGEPAESLKQRSAEVSFTFL